VLCQPAPVLEVPAVVQTKAVEAGAEAWLAGLDDLVAGLAEEWELALEGTYEEGTEAFVAAVRCADGTPAVLKLLVPRSGDASAHEITVLRLVDGDGCARLLRHDEGRDAMLLERLGPSMHQLAIPFEERLPALVDLARRVWRPAPDSGLPSGAEKAAWLADHIARSWEALDRPCAERTVAGALACTERRLAAHDDERAVLVHGDIHQWNALRSADGWALVDPDGLLAEPEYDLGILMREDPEELLAGDPWDRARQLARRCGCDATAVWEWGVIERVSTGLVCTAIDLQPEGRQMLHAADVVAALD
jgi:streptomycin 6-kinase